VDQNEKCSLHAKCDETTVSEMLDKLLHHEINCLTAGLLIKESKAKNEF
jgi:hypothetical protein